MKPGGRSDVRGEGPIEALEFGVARTNADETVREKERQPDWQFQAKHGADFVSLRSLNPPLRRLRTKA